MRNILKKINFGIFTRKVYLSEILIIILLGNIILITRYFYDFLNIFPKFFSYNSLTNKAERFDWRGFDDLSSFIEKNLNIDDSYNESIYGKRKAFWPDGNVAQGPTYLIPKEEKPYYLFNINVYFPAYNLKLFRKFTKGDGTPEFAEKHEEIKGVVFYQKDLDKLLKIKRKIKKIILQDNTYKIYVGNCTINNGIWRLYKTNFRKNEKYWKFISSDSSDLVEYRVVASTSGSAYAHYLELPKIIDKHFFRGEYFFSVKNVTINPLLPFVIVCDIKTNYPGINIKAFVGVYDVNGNSIEKLILGGEDPSSMRGVWSKESGGNLSSELRKRISKKRKGLKDIYKLEKIIVGVSYRSNKDKPRNTLGFQPLGILLFGD